MFNLTDIIKIQIASCSENESIKYWTTATKIMFVLDHSFFVIQRVVYYLVTI